MLMTRMKKKKKKKKKRGSCYEYEINILMTIPRFERGLLAQVATV
jgi:hypothetical protein